MKPGKKNRMPNRCLGLVLAAAVILLISAWGCGTPENGDNGRGNGNLESCINVDIARVETRDLEENINSIGSMEAFQNVSVQAETGGILKEVHFEEGAEMEKGDLLFTIDDAKIRAELRARQAALEEAKANRENAELVYKRRQRLYEDGLGTQEARDEARTRHQALTAQVKRLEAEIENIKETLEDTRIRAPFDGIAGEHRVDPGQLVNPGTKLTYIIQTERLKIAFTVPERHMGRIRTGQEIRVEVPAYPDKTFPGRVYFVEPQISPATRSLRIKAKMDNPENLLRPGGFASVNLITGMRENVLTIPEEALIPTRTGYMVFTVKDSRAKGREVEIGLRRPGIVEITDGLEKGETIVRAGHISLYEGAAVCSGR